MQKIRETAWGTGGSSAPFLAQRLDNQQVIRRLTRGAMLVITNIGPKLPKLWPCRADLALPGSGGQGAVLLLAFDNEPLGAGRVAAGNPCEVDTGAQVVEVCGKPAVTGGCRGSQYRPSADVEELQP